MSIKDWIKRISQKEGLKKQINIAQLSEVHRCYREEIYERLGIDIDKLIRLIPKRFSA